MFYFLALENCNMFFSKPAEYKEGATYYSTGTKKIQTEAQHKILLAYSIPDGTLTWRYPQVGKGASWGGTLTTAGGLVFFGDDTGSFAAVDARTGHPLWEFNTGQTFRASPMSYEVDGVQYVAIAAGSDVISFSLPHEAIHLTSVNRMKARPTSTGLYRRIRELKIQLRTAR
jgi:alcohol dehydrogenase (cytochrome c)